MTEQGINCIAILQLFVVIGAIGVFGAFGVLVVLIKEIQAGLSTIDNVDSP